MSGIPGPGGQMALAGFAPQARTDRLFFALFPDRETASRIAGLAADLRARHGLSGRLIPCERLHVTLHFLGDHPGLDPALLDAARAAAARVEMAAFDIAFDQVGSFGGQRRDKPCVLRMTDGDAPVHELWRRLGGSLRREGLGRLLEQRSFTPHLTVLYDRQAVPLQAAGPVGWRVRDFRLVHSTVGRPAYRCIGGWKLAS